MHLEIIKQSPLQKGAGTPVLFVHGMWHGAWCWQEYFLPYFASKGFEAWALSLRGHGQSAGKEKLRWTSAADYVEDVEQAVRQMDSPPILVGHSMGGMIVQKYLETHHDIPAAVLLASGPPAGLLAATLRTARRFPGALVKANLTLSLYPIVSTKEKAQQIFFSDSLKPDLVQKYFDRLQDESYRAFLDLLIFNLQSPKKVKTPVLVLGAENDRIISKKDVQRTAKAYGVSPVFFPDMAHDMMLESKWQDVADHIIRWLNKNNL